MNVDLARIQFASTSIYHFLFVPVTIGLGFLVAILQTMWYRGGDPEYKRLTQVLRHAARDQRRDRCGDGARAGVRVRDELVELLAYRRRRVRCAARDGRARGVLPRVNVPRPLAVRLGSAAEADPPRHNLARRPWRCALGRVHHGGELMDAASGRVRDRPDHEPAGAEQHRRGVHEPGLRVGIPARRARVTRHRGARDARRVRHGISVATAPRVRSSAPRRRPSSCWCRRSS